MPLSKGKEAEVQESKRGPERDIYNMVLKMVVSVLLNFVARKFRQKQERRKAIAKVERLERKGKKVPEKLRQLAEAGGRRGKKKALKAAARKAEKKKKARRRARRLILLLVVIAVAAVAARAKKAAG